ncbi:MAG: homocysteine S-methyltransferase family protein [Bacteroidales bacterium]|nr:homocysteine S-methyltransferase family protein [Bacteroidales bacterium]
MHDRPDIRKQLKSSILLLDGAMGTMLQSSGLDEKDFRGEQFRDHMSPLKGNFDILSLTRPELITQLHHAYLEAGADIITTNTFNATSVMQSGFDTGNMAYEINLAAAKLARAAAEYYTGLNPGQPRFVAGSMGPTNRTSSLFSDREPSGSQFISFPELYDAYREQARGLVDGGADILLLETITDISNARVALYAINDVFIEKDFGLPIMISFTVTGKDGHIIAGYPLNILLQILSDPHIFCIGLNCGSGIDHLIPYINDLASLSTYYTCFFPSAGIPDHKGRYAGTPKIMASKMKELFDLGLVNIIGGCCGTGPEHIKMFSYL